jgi:hypothetical protein
LNYLVQCATDLAQNNWQNLGQVAAATNQSVFLDTNSPAASAQVFYRVLLLP